MSIPAGDVAIPARVRELAESAALSPVWENGVGGLTFGTDDGRFIKWGPRHLETTMRDEAERIRWAATSARVPQVRSGRILACAHGKGLDIGPASV
ncbi:hypothetical protein [Microbacterium panaciterrae]|uniref:Uncharacterized protein n=1 Tax=Microbacterium panaciterrae TaxID=985759 RepID=A0ABP8PLL4_9MICO